MSIRAKFALAVSMLFLTVIFLSPVSFAEGASNEQESAEGQAGGRHLTVTGTAEVMVMPDEVVFSLSVETSDMDIMKAKSGNDDSIKKIKAAAKKYGIEDKYVVTDYINVNPKYTYNNNGESIFKGYTVYRGLKITLKNLSKFDDFLTEILSTGANYVQNVQFRTTQLRKYKDEARTLAIRAAKEKASALAKELGQTIGKANMIQEIQEDTYNPWSSSYLGLKGSNANSISNAVVNAPEASSGQEYSGDFSPGQITVSAKIQVTFDLN